MVQASPGFSYINVATKAGSPALLTVSRNSLTYSSAVRFPWVMLSSFLMDSSFSSLLRKAALKAVRNTALVSQV